MERWMLKLVCTAVALLVSLICTFLPFKMAAFKKRKRKQKIKNNTSGETGNGIVGHINDEIIGENEEKEKSKREMMEEEKAEDEREASILRILMCFGGGVFMGTFLLHMLPEVNELLDTHLTAPNNIEYPVAEVLIGAGFFLMLSLDVLVVVVRRIGANRKTRRVDGVDGMDGLGSGMGGSNGGIDNKVYKITDTKNDDDSLKDATTRATLRNHPRQPDYQTLPQNHHEAINMQYQTATRSLVLVIALSLHHIFEGMSIGLQMEFSNVWHLTLAVLIHETAICFSMGLQFYKMDKKLSSATLITLATASTVMPIGILIGTALSEIGQGGGDDGGRNVFNGVLQALACGTFIYVTFFEIIFENLLYKENRKNNDGTCDETKNHPNNPNIHHTDLQSPPSNINPHHNDHSNYLSEYGFHQHDHNVEDDKDLFWKHLALFLGFVFMALLALIPDKHDHEH